MNILGGHFCDNFITEWGESRGKGQHFWPTPAVVTACPRQEGWTVITALCLGLKSLWSASVWCKKSLVEINLVLICTAPVMYCHASFWSGNSLLQEVCNTSELRGLFWPSHASKRSFGPQGLMSSPAGGCWTALNMSGSCLFTQTPYCMTFSSPNFWELWKCWPRWLIVQVRHFWAKSWA